MHRSELLPSALLSLNLLIELLFWRQMSHVFEFAVLHSQAA